MFPVWIDYIVIIKRPSSEGIATCELLTIHYFLSCFAVGNFHIVFIFGRGVEVKCCEKGVATTADNDTPTITGLQHNNNLWLTLSYQLLITSQ